MMKHLIKVVVIAMMIAASNVMTAHTEHGFVPFAVEQEFNENGFSWFRHALLLAAGDEQQSNAMTIGYCRNDELLMWILRNMIYNVRLNKRKGAVEQTYIANKASKLLLYNQKNHQIYKYYNLSVRIEKVGAERMIELQRPDYQ